MVISAHFYCVFAVLLLATCSVRCPGESCAPIRRVRNRRRHVLHLWKWRLLLPDSRMRTLFYRFLRLRSPNLSRRRVQRMPTSIWYRRLLLFSTLLYSLADFFTNFRPIRINGAPWSISSILPTETSSRALSRRVPSSAVPSPPSDSLR